MLSRYKADYRLRWKRLTRVVELAAAVVIVMAIGVASSVNAMDLEFGSPVISNEQKVFMRALAQSVRVETEGEINVKITRATGATDAFNRLASGELDMAFFSASSLIFNVPDLAVLTMPGLWSSEEEKNWVIDTQAAAVIREILESHGLILLRIGEIGWHSIYCSFACTDPDTLAGRVARPFFFGMMREFWTIVGATVPEETISYTEAPRKFEAGEYEVGEARLISPMKKFAEKKAHFVFTRHIHEPSFLLVNRGTWDGLGIEQKQKLRRILPTTAFMREAIAVAELVEQEKFVQAGGYIHHLSDEESAKWRAKLMPSHSTLVASYGGRAADLFDAIQKGKTAFENK